MKRMILFLLCVLMCRTPTFAGMTYDQAYYNSNRGYLGSGGYNDPLYQLWGTLEGLYEGTANFDAIRIIESTGATYYTKIQGGNQSANLTLTLPTAYAATTGYVLSSTDAGVLSWVANGGTFTGGNVTSDIVLNADGVDILADTTTAHTFAIQGYADAGSYKDVLRMTNGAAVAMVLGASDVSLAIASTGLDVSAAGAVSGVTTLNASGAITATGGLVLQNGATVTNATDSEVTLTDTSEDLTFDMDSASNVVGLKSTTGVNGLAMGDVDDLKGVGTITFDAAAATITTATSGDAQDLTLSVTGANNSSLVLASSGTAADALTISTSAGGMDVTVAGGAADEDLDLTANTSINVKASESSADDAIVIETLGAGSGMQITSLADIDITTTGAAGEDITITNTGGSVNIRANENDVAAIVIDTAGGGGTSEEINILNDQGTGSASIDIDSTAGSIDVDAGDDIAIDAVDDLTLNGGSAGSIINLGTNTQGNVIHVGDNDTTADSITIGSAKDTTSLAGISVTVGSTGTTSATTVRSGTGDLALTSTDDITLTVNTAATDNITLTNTPGTAANAIAIQATAGGIDIDGAAALDVDISGGQVLLSSKDNAASAIALTANIGTNETIVVTNTQGTGAGSIALTASAGGITLSAGADDAVAVTTGSGGISLNVSTNQPVNIATGTSTGTVTIGGAAAQTIAIGTGAAAKAVTLGSKTGASATILQSGSADLDIDGAGGIDIDAVTTVDILAGGAFSIDGSNAASNISLATNGDTDDLTIGLTGATNSSIILNSTGTGADAIGLVASAGSISVSAAAGGVDITGLTGHSIASTATADGSYGLEVSGAIAGATGSEGAAAYFHSTITGNVDNKTYNIGSWLDITGGTPADGGGTEAIFAAADLGIYGAAGAAELADAKLRVLNIEYQVDADCAPVESSTFIHFNCNDTEDTPDYLFTTGNAASAVYTANVTHTAASTDKLGAIKINIGAIGDAYIYVYSSAGQ